MRLSLAAAAIAACGLAVSAAQADMKREWIDYQHGDAKLKAYMAYEQGAPGRRPAVLMIHAREGMTARTLKLAEIWAGLGYVSFAADIFGNGPRRRISCCALIRYTWLADARYPSSCSSVALRRSGNE